MANLLSAHVSGKEAVIAKLMGIPELVDRAYLMAASRVQAQLPVAVAAIFRNAASMSGEGFPAIYLTELETVVMTNKPIINAAGATGASVGYDFDALGSWGDLVEGYHYHAKLEDGSLSELPYTGAALKHDLDTRYLFWQNLELGFGTRRRRGKGQRTVEPNLNIRQNTYAARVTYWESKGVAPQWLLLNFGQTEYDPIILPYPVIENVLQLMRDMYLLNLYQAVDTVLKAHMGSAYQGAPSIGNFANKPGHYVQGVGGRMAGSIRG